VLNPIALKVEADLHLAMERYPGLKERWTALFRVNHTDGTAYRHEVNAFLRTQLGALGVATVDVRLCLDDECEYKRWLVLLNRYVFPMLAKHNLPVSFEEIVTWHNQGI